MKFILIDSILEQSTERIIAIKQVSLAEEYLADHFPSFPVLPGVLMIEAMVQAARAMLSEREGEMAGAAAANHLVLGEVKALKFGSMVRPGEALEIEVTLSKAMEDGSFQCKGAGVVRRRGGTEDRGETAVSGKFTMRPVRQ